MQVLLKMASRNLLKLKVAVKEGKGKVLLIMPPDIAPAFQPHLGLGILANSLSRGGV